MGPITLLLDGVGIDVAEKVGPIMEAAFGDRVKRPTPHRTSRWKTAASAARRRRGFYTYDGKKKKGGPDTSGLRLAAARRKS
ncbi:MAG: hypothetical protein IPJ65_38910 [Archangiaceae bacterium]|nr:hypothetical protein [Archangiaceae bacterium]